MKIQRQVTKTEEINISLACGQRFEIALQHCTLKCLLASCAMNELVFVCDDGSRVGDRFSVENIFNVQPHELPSVVKNARTIKVFWVNKEPINITDEIRKLI